MEIKYFAFFTFLAVSIAIFSFVIGRKDEENFYRERKLSNITQKHKAKVIVNNTQRLKQLIGMSGFLISIEKLYTYKIVSAALSAALAAIIFRNVYFILPSIFGGFFIPNAWLSMRKNKRQDELLSQLPETLERVANYMKSGSSIVTAIQSTEEDDVTLEPMRTELLYILADIRKGMSVEDAMKKASEERIIIPEFKMVSLATQIHAELGGNMPETYENVSKTIKDKAELIETIRVSTTEARLSGWIVGTVPVVAFLGIKYIYPSFTDEAMKVPVANLLYAVAFVWDALGLLLTRKLADVSKEVRAE